MAAFTVDLIADGMNKPFVLTRPVGEHTIELRGRYRPRTLTEIEDWRRKVGASNKPTHERAKLLAERIVEWSVHGVPPTEDAVSRLPAVFFEELETVVNSYAFTTAELDEKKSS